MTRVQVETLLELAVLAPNHRMTAPWRFLVVGPDARAPYGRAVGNRKAGRFEDPDAARAAHDRALAEVLAAPLVLAVVQVVSPKPDVAEEDYAAIWMAIQNVLLGAVALGLAASIRTGTTLGDPSVRQAWGVADGERVVGVIMAGEPDGAAEPKARVPAAERTVWLP